MTDEQDQAASPPDKRDAPKSGRRYRKTLITAVLSVLIVTIIPLLIMTGIADHQYRKALRAELLSQKRRHITIYCGVCVSQTSVASRVSADLLSQKERHLLQCSTQ